MIADVENGVNLKDKDADQADEGESDLEGDVSPCKQLSGFTSHAIEWQECNARRMLLAQWKACSTFQQNINNFGLQLKFQPKARPLQCRLLFHKRHILHILSPS